MLKETFQNLLSNYTTNDKLIAVLWDEIEQNYTNKKRHYHTLSHLDNLLKQLTEIKTELKNWDAILFALFYHDVIYNALKANNEEKSAELAVKRMTELAVPQNTVDLCFQQIMATKSHAKSANNDTNYFTDADLSVLGHSWNLYTIYFQNVRKEYAKYPSLIYNPGRKKVLQHFLSMERIYKTDFFKDKFEAQARLNLQKEVELL